MKDFIFTNITIRGTSIIAEDLSNGFNEIPFTYTGGLPPVLFVSVANSNGQVNSIGPLVDENNEFSNLDRADNYENRINGYVTTPNGSLLLNKYIEGESVSDYLSRQYDPEIISEEMPSDPKDPSRKNNNSAYEK